MNKEDFNAGFKLGVEAGKKEALEKIYEALGLYDLVAKCTEHLEGDNVN